MTKLEELKSACVAAWDAAWGVAAARDIACDAAWDAYDCAYDAYQAELNKENTND